MRTNWLVIILSKNNMNIKKVVSNDSGSINTYEVGVNGVTYIDVRKQPTGPNTMQADYIVMKDNNVYARINALNSTFNGEFHRVNVTRE
jgi:hypothetical protein